jgi:AcrR family transcriptional regulator
MMTTGITPPVTGPPASLRERKKLATRQLLRRVALDLVAERGLGGVTVEDIAEAANVSPRTFFNYFPSKEAALFPGNESRAEELRAGIASVAPGEPALAALRAVLVRHAETMADDLLELGGDPGDWLRKIKAARADPQVRAAHAAQMAMIERAVGEGLATRIGTSAEADPYPWVTAAATVGVLRACVAFWASSSGTVPLTRLVEEAFGALAGGLPEDTALRQFTAGARDRKDVS